MNMRKDRFSAVLIFFYLVLCCVINGKCCVILIPVNVAHNGYRPRCYIKARVFNGQRAVCHYAAAITVFDGQLALACNGRIVVKGNSISAVRYGGVAVDADSHACHSAQDAFSALGVIGAAVDVQGPGLGVKGEHSVPKDIRGVAASNSYSIICAA